MSRLKYQRIRILPLQGAAKIDATQCAYLPEHNGGEHILYSNDFILTEFTSPLVNQFFVSLPYMDNAMLVSNGQKRVLKSFPIDCRNR